MFTRRSVLQAAAGLAALSLSATAALADWKKDYPELIIAAVPDLIAALEACVAEFRSIAATNGKAHTPEACSQAIAALDLAFGRASGPASADDPAARGRELSALVEAAR